MALSCCTKGALVPRIIGQRRAATAKAAATTAEAAATATAARCTEAPVVVSTELKQSDVIATVHIYYESLLHNTNQTKLKKKTIMFGTHIVLAEVGAPKVIRSSGAEAGTKAALALRLEPVRNWLLRLLNTQPATPLHL